MRRGTTRERFDGWHTVIIHLSLMPTRGLQRVMDRASAFFRRAVSFRRLGEMAIFHMSLGDGDMVNAFNQCHIVGGDMTDHASVVENVLFFFRQVLEQPPQVNHAANGEPDG